MATPEITQRWRKEFDDLGYDVVAAMLARAHIAPDERAELAVEWLKAHAAARSRREQRRFWTMLVLTVLTLLVAAVAAVISWLDYSSAGLR